MEKVIINSYEEFEKLVGQQIGVSEWLEIPQERINQFADTTLDHQWIHVDAERAKVESPYKSTIRVSYLVFVALSVESDYRGEQLEDDGELWNGQDEVRPGSIVR